MSSAPRGLAPHEGLGSVLMKMGRAGPPFEPRRRPQAGKSGDPRSQNADKLAIHEDLCMTLEIFNLAAKCARAEEGRLSLLELPEAEADDKKTKAKEAMRKGPAVQCPPFLFGAKGASAGESIKQRHPFWCNDTKTSPTAGRKSLWSPSQRHHQSLWQARTNFSQDKCTRCSPSKWPIVGALPAQYLGRGPGPLPINRTSHPQGRGIEKSSRNRSDHHLEASRKGC